MESEEFLLHANFPNSDILLQRRKNEKVKIYQQNTRNLRNHLKFKLTFSL